MAKRCDVKRSLPALKHERSRQFQLGMACLPNIPMPSVGGRNGEDLATDEAAVWKRVLNYRIAKHIRPKSILETHKGLGVGTRLYQYAYPDVRIFDHETYVPSEDAIEMVDIDPFGQPWDSIEAYSAVLQKCNIALVSNGEAQAVVRNLRRAQRFPTNNFGRKMPVWVVNEYVPRLEDVLSMACCFYYAFPTTVRTIHSRIEMPIRLFRDCPRWMWWLARYSGDVGEELCHG